MRTSCHPQGIWKDEFCAPVIGPCPPRVALASLPLAPDLERILNWIGPRSPTFVKSVFKKEHHARLLLSYFLLYTIQRTALLDSGKVDFQFHIRNSLNLQWLLHLKSLRYVLIQNSIKVRKLPGQCGLRRQSLFIYTSLSKRNENESYIMYCIKDMGNPDDVWLRPFLSQIKNGFYIKRRGTARPHWWSPAPQVQLGKVIRAFSSLEMETCI